VDSESRANLLRILEKARIDPEHWLGEEARYKTPVLEKALFLREALAPVLRVSDTSWIDKTIEDLESRVGRKDLYARKRSASDVLPSRHPPRKIGLQFTHWSQRWESSGGG
jgi:hypothetical protein